MMKSVVIFRNVSLSTALLLALSAADMAGSTAAASTDVPGNLTNARDLVEIRRLANDGVQPHVRNRNKVKRAASKDWEHGNLSGRYQGVGPSDEKRCKVNGRAGVLKEAAPDIYAKVLAYHLTDNEAFASQARKRLRQLASSRGFKLKQGNKHHSGRNQCVLELSLSIPVYIESALLLESYDRWTEDDRAKFADWLRDVYHYPAWASRWRSNNWGSAASAASWAIAHYLSTFDEDEVLREKKPRARQLTPEQAMKDHEKMALMRMDANSAWPGEESKCKRDHGIHGVQPTGGIPDELRRGDGNCELAFIPRAGGKPHKYQTMHVAHLILHGEMLRRAGSNSIFEFTLGNGHNAIERAILFVIKNPVKPAKSFKWPNDHRGALYIAHNALENAEICDEAKRPAESVRLGRTLPYAKVTHPFKCG